MSPTGYVNVSAPLSPTSPQNQFQMMPVGFQPQQQQQMVFPTSMQTMQAVQQPMQTMQQPMQTMQPMTTMHMVSQMPIQAPQNTISMAIQQTLMKHKKDDVGASLLPRSLLEDLCEA
jgi:hypothetical protein